MKPTLEQRQAIETQDRSLIIQAGAGTGKTWVLVRRFMHLLETNPDWSLESILAITFTEKAAREMRGRIRTAVEEKVKQYPQDSTWQARRRGLNRLRVSTIHSLCARILRENAIAASIDPRFAVLDEQEADLRKEEAIRETIRQLDADDHPALELLASLQVRELSDIMADFLSKRGTLTRLFEDLNNPEELLERWQKGLEKMQRSLWEQCQREDSNLSDALIRLPGVTMLDTGDKLADSVMLGQEGCQHLKNDDLIKASEVWDEIDLRGGKQANWGGKEELKALKDDLKSVRTAARELEKQGALQTVGADDETAAQHLQLWSALWEQLNRVYGQIKEEIQSLDFDDLELFTAQLLAQKPCPPRLQTFLKGVCHLMVDEFQDTNIIQQQIVYHIAPPKSTRLFVVGDAKQSIYRFRQAQVSIFEDTAKDIQEKTGHRPIELSTSFRTQESLMMALNDLFNVILQPLGQEWNSYEAPPGPLQAHRPPHPTLPTPIEMLLLPKEDAHEESVNAEEGRIWEARWLAQRLLRLKEEEFQVWDKEQNKYRPFEFGDAAILFRATTNFPLYETAFKAAGLPYLTVSGRGYYNRAEVRDTIALLRVLHNPDDDLSLASVLRSPLFNFSDETLYCLRWHTSTGEISIESVSYRQALAHPPQTNQPDEVAFAKEVFDELWELVGRVDVWTLLRTALDLTGYEAILALNDGETGRQWANVKKFLGLARDYGGASLSDFLRRLQDLQTREAREGEALGSEPESGAVQLMSIHAAKGLEFPVVVVADLGRRKQSGFSSPYLLHDPAFGLVCKQRDEYGDWQKAAGYAWGEWLFEAMEEAENKRLLYVACTRAADKLILSGKIGEKKSWLTEIIHAWDIDPEGEETEDLLRNEYKIRVHRPTTPLESVSSIPIQKEQPAGQKIIHPLAKPCPTVYEVPSIAVTRLDQFMSREAGIQEFQPALWTEEKQKSADRAPGYLVGNIVHRALAHWDCLSSSEQELFQFLENIAQREGVFPNALAHAVKTSRWMLGNVQKHPLFWKINAATTRRHELPFTLPSPVGTLHGVIDLLYQDENGLWHVIDWKTEWAPEGELEENSQEHMIQMAVYDQAIQSELGTVPEVELCYLNPKVVLYPFSSDKLASVWEDILSF